MNTIFKTLNSMNNFSKTIILISSSIAVMFCIVGICLIVYNTCFVHGVELYNIGARLIQKSTIVFAHFTIGALVIDWFNANMQNDD